LAAHGARRPFGPWKNRGVSAVRQQAPDAEQLKEQIVRLAPWHLDVQVTPEVSTAVSLEAPAGGNRSAGGGGPGAVTFLKPRRTWERLIGRIYQDGFAGRSFLDCACNCGAYSFWAKELGATRCFGFDVREHWIDQARFLAENRTWPSDGITFERMDLYELPNRRLEGFDVTMFQGIFYHLPDPITGLKIATDLTKDLLILDTATRNGQPDGMLAIGAESRDEVMSGVYGLNWFPTGPGVLTQILEWLGFPECRVVHWRGVRRGQPPAIGRIRMVASRREGLLEGIDSVRSPSGYRTARGLASVKRRLGAVLGSR
jgi:tRNA (mo5U34)-methyltransferase